MTTSIESPYNCHYCHMTFRHRGNRNRHERNSQIHHYSFVKRPLRCKYRHCGEVFDRVEMLTRHEISHKARAPYNCKLCCRAFTYNRDLKIHQRRHNGDRPYLCSYCNETFSQSATRQLHERMHNGLKPYKCPYCDIESVSKGNAIKHERIHIGSSKGASKCDLCGKVYANFDASAKEKHRRGRGCRKTKSQLQ